VSRDLDADLRFAHTLADAADEITLDRFRALDLVVETKPDLTPVSEADQAAEEAVRKLVRESGRREGVLGEEYDDVAGDVRWIVDPIDGTKSYVRGVPVWATLLALEVGGSVDVAVVSAPALGRRWWATRGGGAFGDGMRLSVSRVAAIEDATVSCTSERSLPPGWSRLARRAWAARGWADFWQHCLVAEGAIEVAVENGLQIWDYSAVSLLVEEAGGRMSTFDGEPLRPDGTVLATNGLLHAEAMALLSAL
jgi:histidinol-phosphatase